MKTTTVRQFIAAFTTAIVAARTEGGHEALRMKLTMAALPLDARVRLLGAIESSERAYRKAA